MQLGRYHFLAKRHFSSSQLKYLVASETFTTGNCHPVNKAQANPSVDNNNRNENQQIRATHKSQKATHRSKGVNLNREVDCEGDSAGVLSMLMRSCLCRCVGGLDQNIGSF
jgi:hypothetical protein